MLRDTAKSLPNKISVFGLGKVGITLSAALASAGFRVFGVDVVPTLVEAIRNGSFSTNEPGVMDRLSILEPGAFTATMDSKTAIHETSATFIIVPTPSNTLGGFSNGFVMQSLETIGKALASKASPHVVALISTVLPGSSSTQLIPALELAAGRRIGDRLGYCYNPSFIAQGDVMKGLIQPDYVLIGEADETSGQVIEAIHRKMVQNNAPIVRMTPTEAEITKISSNTHETMRVAFANMLLALCNELPHVDVDRITSALTYRLGRRFFKGAVPYGGPCWPRDNRALAAFMDLVGVPSTLPNAVDRANSDHGSYLLRQVMDVVPYGGSVGLIGLAYKPGTSMIDCSFGINLAKWLAAEGRRVTAWDPMAASEAARALGSEVIIASEPEQTFDADATVIALPLVELQTVNWKHAEKSKILDFWRVLSVEQISEVGSYVAVGAEKLPEKRDIIDASLKEHFAHLIN